MVKPVDHDMGSATATVVGNTAKGAVGGVAAFGLLGALVVGGLAFISGAPAVLVPALIGGAISAVMGAVTGATVGSVIGATTGVLKVKNENDRFKQVAHSQEQHIASNMTANAQQAYMDGVQEGQAQVVNKLREVQAQQVQISNPASYPADNQDGKWADRFKKNNVTPEAIAQQRETAAHAAPQVG